tara:strand:- start:352 stop:798 length:447 start_codon:yes stop_codon:yes gene_type:complete
MKIRFITGKTIKSIALLLICLFVFLFQINSQILNALPMENYQDEIVIEELRLKVPAQFKEVWLNTEKKIWEPWLFSQDGFLGRQLFWDKEKEEALILVNWKSKKLWKSIPISEVNLLQEKFEDNVKTALNVNINPFELIYEGELVKQG